MADLGASNRRFPRYLTDTEVMIYQGQKMIKARIKQISRGGCLVLPQLPPTGNEALRISFRLSEDAAFINCKGDVVYSFPDKGTGIAFTEISEYNQDRITSAFDKQPATERQQSA